MDPNDHSPRRSKEVAKDLDTDNDTLQVLNNARRNTTTIIDTLRRYQQGFLWCIRRWGFTPPPPFWLGGGDRFFFKNPPKKAYLPPNLRWFMVISLPPAVAGWDFLYHPLPRIPNGWRGGREINP